jgi:hypothetical protein
MTSSNNGRASSDGRRDLRPAREVLRVLARYAPIVLLTATLVGGVVVLVGSITPQSHTAVSRVSLTERIVWPFYDTERERMAELAAQPKFRHQIDNALPPGTEITELRLDLPVDQAYVEVVARAPDDQTAINASNIAAAILVDESRRRIDGNALLRLQEAEERLSAIEATIKSLTERLGAGGLAPDDLDEIRQRREAEYIRLHLFVAERDRAALELDTSAIPPVELLRDAEIIGNDPGRLSRTALLAALTAAVLAVAGAILFDARRARIRGPGHVRYGTAGAIPVIHIDAGSVDRRGALANRILGLGPQNEVLGIVGAAGSEPRAVIRNLVEGVRAAGGRSVTVGSEPESAAGPTLLLSDLAQSADGNPDRVLEDAAGTLTRAGGVHIRLEPEAPFLHAAFLALLLDRVSAISNIVVLSVGQVVGPETWPAMPQEMLRRLIVVAATEQSRQIDLRHVLDGAAHRGAQVVGILLYRRSELEPAKSARRPDASSASAVRAVEALVPGRTG